MALPLGIHVYAIDDPSTTAAEVLSFRTFYIARSALCSGKHT